MERNKNDNRYRSFVFRLWKREVSGEPLLDKENKLLNFWMQLAATKITSEESREDRQQVLHALEASMPKPAGVPVVTSVNRYRYLWAAAILLLLSLGGLFTYRQIAAPQIYSAAGSAAKVQLADGSVVTLMPGAYLAVEKSFPAATRDVTLKGDAVFNVAKDPRHPFIVHAQGFTTKVLGTVFKVTQRGGSHSVDLYEGKVAVSSPGAKSVYLTPAQTWTNFGVARTSAVITRSAKTEKNSERVIQQLNFSSVPLSEAVAVLQKHYNVRITYPEVYASRKITAYLKGSREDNIDMLAFAVGLEASGDAINGFSMK